MTAVQKNIMRSKTGGAKREPKEFDERVIEVSRVSRVVKGGRRIRFRALVVIGNHNGRIGMGIAKANEVAEAVRKATTSAKKHMVTVPIIAGTIPHEVNVKHGGARILLKPAAEGTSIVAGGSVRSVAELVGITDLLSKSLGSSNKINNVTATFKALTSFNPGIVAQVESMHNKKNDFTSKPKTESVEEVAVKEEVPMPQLEIEDAGSRPESVGKAAGTVKNEIKDEVKITKEKTPAKPKSKKETK